MTLDELTLLNPSSIFCSTFGNATISTSPLQANVLLCYLGIAHGKLPPQFINLYLRRVIVVVYSKIIDDNRNDAYSDTVSGTFSALSIRFKGELETSWAVGFILSI